MLQFCDNRITGPLYNHNCAVMLQLNVTKCPLRCSCSSCCSSEEISLQVGTLGRLVTSADQTLDCLIESMTWLFLHYSLRAHKSLFLSLQHKKRNRFLYVNIKQIKRPFHYSSLVFTSEKFMFLYECTLSLPPPAEELLGLLRLLLQDSRENPWSLKEKEGATFYNSVHHIVFLNCQRMYQLLW